MTECLGKYLIRAAKHHGYGDTKELWRRANLNPNLVWDHYHSGGSVEELPEKCRHQAGIPAGHKGYYSQDTKPQMKFMEKADWMGGWLEQGE